MNWLVYHIVSGHAFFTGVALVIVAAVASARSGRIARRITVLAFVVGVIAVVVSSTAIGYWLYGLAIVATAAWVISRFVVKWRRWARYAVVVAWCIAGASELPCHITPTLKPVSARSITVIGDSVTAGIGGEEESERWPEILAADHDLQVQDISHMGETAASALKRVKTRQITSPVIIVEIGGNDLLGSTSAEQFSHDLDALLTHVGAPERQVIMFELPLPPFCHEYGRVQRTLAKRHHVALVPKRIILSIIGGSGSTLDTIHLSQAGHQRMADCVWRLVGSAFPAKRGAG